MVCHGMVRLFGCFVWWYSCIVIGWALLMIWRRISKTVTFFALAANLRCQKFYDLRWLSVFDVYLLHENRVTFHQPGKWSIFRSLCSILLLNGINSTQNCGTTVGTHKNRTMMIHCQTLFICILHFNHGHEQILLLFWGRSFFLSMQCTFVSLKSLLSLVCVITFL